MNYIFLLVIVAVIIYLINTYNRGIKLKNYVKEAFSTMDVYFKKRWDLIPNLVETVKTYTAHEHNIFTQVVELRSKSYNSMSAEEKLNSNIKLASILPQITAVAENYPELKTNENFKQLMTDLAALEDDIANARKYYNGTVRELNTYTEIFPSNIVCSMLGIHNEKLFVISETERKNVSVNFN